MTVTTGTPLPARETPARLAWSMTRVRGGYFLGCGALFLAGVLFLYVVAFFRPPVSVQIILALAMLGAITFFLTPKDAKGDCPHCGLQTSGEMPAFNCRMCQKRVAVVRTEQGHKLRAV